MFRSHKRYSYAILVSLYGPFNVYAGQSRRTLLFLPLCPQLLSTEKAYCQVFDLLIWLFPQQVAHGRIMHPQMPGNLTLTVSML
jgi:hypothetical protein